MNQVPLDTSAASPHDSGDASRQTTSNEVDDAVQNLLGSEKALSSAPTVGNSTVGEGVQHPSKSSLPTFGTKVFDKFGMVAPPPRVPIGLDAQQLLPLLPDVLREHVRAHCLRCNIQSWTLPQATTFSYVLEGRDVICISPTASGKTLAFLIPSLMQVLAQAGHVPGMSKSGDKDAQDIGSSDMSSDNLAALTRQRIATGEVCKYCEMDVFTTPVCSFTGHPHRIPDLDHEAQRRRVRTKLDDLTSVSEPKLLIVVPTNELVTQILAVLQHLHCGFRICGFRRRSETSNKYLEGCDILITSPEQVVKLLYKNKLSLRKIRVCVMDEADALFSTQFFEPMKIILGSLPKGVDRPQRLLFGATLPPPTFEMIRRDMLLPSHRFILATPSSVPVSRSTPMMVLNSNSKQVTHTILMVSRVEKLDVLFNLFESGTIRGDQRTIIFCQKAVLPIADSIQEKLAHGRAAGAVRVVSVTSKQSPETREAALKMFQSGVASVLVCSDLLGRGVDFHKVVNVIHFAMPLDIEQWVHRSGRCGRHGMQGYVFSFFQPEDIRLAKPLVSILRQNRQLVPPKLQEYASRTFVDNFKNSLHHHPTKGYNPRNPERHTPVVGRGVAKIPDYQQHSTSRNFRPW